MWQCDKHSPIIATWQTYPYRRNVTNISISSQCNENILALQCDGDILMPHCEKTFLNVTMGRTQPIVAI